MTITPEKRLDFMTKLHELRTQSPASPDADSSNGLTTDSAVSLDKTTLWRALLLRNPTSSFEKPPSTLDVSPSTSSADGEFVENPRSPRRRRSAHTRNHHHNKHGQLMRVGCILGTCQVQNLSHRLYQLVGQTGREDSSPMNPNSPHSYG
ncbi:protein ADM2a [Trichomycterus rosablanca]|uniref:protein ADM2a n=1 Tax=Trichomycterus rosablanca TaxID=2290929 RepID=UPI002F354AAB